MSFFPVSGDFTPLFRLLDDYDSHRSSSGTQGGRTQTIRSFQPKFDVREEKDSYVLHGELPGIDQKDIDISFADSQTIVIKGRVEREHHSGTPAVEGNGEQKKIESHKPTVEDDPEETVKAKPTSNEVAHHDKHKKAQYKYWVTERSIGEFHRSFTFPQRVDQDAVKASLKNGILSLTVPKAVAKEARKRIQIE